MHKSATTILQKTASPADAVAQRFIAMLAEKKMTKAQLCRESGVSYRTIVNVADGTNVPQPGTAGKLAAALGSSAEYLLTGSGERWVMQDAAPAYGEPEPILAAVRTLSEQTGMPAEQILDAICEAMKKRLREGSKSA